MPAGPELRLDGWQIKQLHSMMSQVGLITQDDELVLTGNTRSADVKATWETREGLTYDRTLEAEAE